MPCKWLFYFLSIREIQKLIQQEQKLSYYNTCLNVQNLVLIKKTSQYFLQDLCREHGDMSPPFQDNHVYVSSSSTQTPVGLHGRSSLTERIAFHQQFCAKPVKPALSGLHATCLLWTCEHLSLSSFRNTTPPCPPAGELSSYSVKCMAVRRVGGRGAWGETTDSLIGPRPNSWGTCPFQTAQVYMCLETQTTWVYLDYPLHVNLLSDLSQRL